jgi:hypothetical protein
MADDEQTGGMIALIPDTPGQFTVPGGDPSGEIHCTLVFLGNDVTDLDEATIEKLTERVMQIAADNGPIEAQIMGPAIWNRDGGPDGSHKPSTNTTLTPADPMVGIHQYAADVARDVLGSGRFPDQFVPWAPHICAGYSLPETVLPKAKGTVRFSTIRLALASKNIDFPLTGWRGEDAGTPDRRYAGNGVMEMTATTETEPEVKEVDGELSLFFPCLAVEGLKTADGRYIEPGSLTTRALPISVLAQTENPGSDGGHAKAKVMGKLDEAWKIPGPEFISKVTGEAMPEGTFVWQGRGTADPESEGGKLALKGYLSGNSIDLSEVDYTDDILFNEDGSEDHQTSVTKGVIAATTLCAIPAFPDAYVEINGDKPALVNEMGEIVPEGEQTLENLIKFLKAEGIEPVTAAAFRAAELGDDCLPCQAAELAGKPPFTKGVAKGLPITDAKTLAKAISGASSLKGPDAEKAKAKIITAAKKLKLESKIPAAWQKGNGPAKAVTSSGPADIPPLEYFTDPMLTGPTPLTYNEETREIFGHIATWRTCHISIGNKCTPPPRSGSDYAYFNTGAMRVMDGDQVRTAAVGHITMSRSADELGHAPLALTAAETVKHYDNVTLAAADVAAGEDAHGIWVHGLVRPELSDGQIRTLLASTPSGDWRPIRGGLEMVACLAVNTPGYPVTRARVASGEMTALVAAGAVRPAEAFANGIDLDALSDKIASRVLAQLGQVVAPVPETTVQRDALALEMLRMDALDDLGVMLPFPMTRR